MQLVQPPLDDLAEIPVSKEFLAFDTESIPHSLLQSVDGDPAHPNACQNRGPSVYILLVGYAVLFDQDKWMRFHRLPNIKISPRILVKAAWGCCPKPQTPGSAQPHSLERALLPAIIVHNADLFRVHC